MNIHLVNWALMATLAATGILTAQADGDDYQVPRNEYGQPDIRGVWNFSSSTPLERPKAFGDRQTMTQEEFDAIIAKEKARQEAIDGKAIITGVGGYNQVWADSLAQGENLRTSLIIDPPDGQMPAFTEDAVIHRGGLGPDSEGERPVRFRVGGIGKDGPEDRGLSERCLMGFNSGPPFMPSMYNNNVQIFQNSNHVVIMTEMIHDARIVPVDDRAYLPEDMPRWSGDSRGHWDGDTLVVETKNFTDKTQSFRSAGIGANMHLTERFTRVADDELHYEFTVNDPTTFVSPFTVLVPMASVEDQMFEYACHEGNYGMINILGGARREEREAAKSQ